jgi:hypothetical protein
MIGDVATTEARGRPQGCPQLQGQSQDDFEAERMTSQNRSYGYDVFSPFTERLPEAGDRLFGPGRDSFFAKEINERKYRLLEGYKRAGDILIENAFADPYDRDNLIFPAIFNFRHYIELALKAIIEEHGPFAGVSIEQKNHKLLELWQLFLGIAAAFGYDCSEATVVAVGRCVDEFATVDAGSTAFR